MALLLVSGVMMLQFAAAGPVDDDAPLPPPLVDVPSRAVVVLDPRVEARLKKKVSSSK